MIGPHWPFTATQYFHKTLDYRILLHILPGGKHPARVVEPPIQPLTQLTELQESQGDGELLPVHCRPFGSIIGNIDNYNLKPGLDSDIKENDMFLLS